VDHECDDRQTDGRTDGRTDRPLAIARSNVVTRALKIYSTIRGKREE